MCTRYVDSTNPGRSRLTLYLGQTMCKIANKSLSNLLPALITMCVCACVCCLFVCVCVCVCDARVGRLSFWVCVYGILFFLHAWIHFVLEIDPLWLHENNMVNSDRFFKCQTYFYSDITR